MNMPNLAGTISSLVFISGTLSMLLKTWRSKDVASYSWTSIVLGNLGNLVYWLYVLSLPIGPIYVLHSFHTVAMVLMLMWCVLYRTHPDIAYQITTTVETIIPRQTGNIRNPQEFRAVHPDE